MARFTYTKTVENFTFNPPTTVSEEEFNQFKLQIRRNQDALTLSYRVSEASIWKADFDRILTSFRITNVR